MGRMQRGNETFGQGVAAEKKSGVKSVASEGVPKKWNGGDVAGAEAGSVVRIGVHELPEGEIRDEEELDSAEERGETDAGDGAAVAEPEADVYADEEAGVDDRDYFVEAYEEVAGKEREEREEKGEAAVLEDRTGKEGHGANGSEIPGMGRNAQGGSENNQSECKRGAV